MADADKDRVAKLKADMPPVPKQAKPAKEATADKAPRAKSAYLVQNANPDSLHLQHVKAFDSLSHVDWYVNTSYVNCCRVGIGDGHRHVDLAL